MRAVIHIGAPKTGTTSLQRSCVMNEAVLLANGVLFAKAGRVFESRTEQRHVGLRFAVKVPASPPDGMMERLGLTTADARSRYAEMFADQLDTEIGEAEPETVLLSDEALFLLGDRSTVEQLSQFLRERFSNILVVCFLRHPVDYVRGLCSQRIKSGDLTRIDLENDPYFANGLYQQRLDYWSAAFGRDEFKVRVADEDIISQFQAVTGITGLNDAEPQDLNKSLNAFGAECFLQLNQRYSKDTRPPIIRRAFEQSMTGKPFSLTATDEKWVWDRFKSEKEGIVRHHLDRDEDVRVVQETWVSSPVQTETSLIDQDIVRETADIISFLSDQIEETKKHHLKTAGRMRKTNLQLRTRVRKQQKKMEVLNAQVDSLSGEIETRIKEIQELQEEIERLSRPLIKRLWS
ncbi:hypothetical protein [Pseudoruegeria sp. HB172150]|uniref:hypothetical protein n=1 Tax=Pseudoruegeria sp. HB172150 TaxID=2721164 RepID=UPI00155569A5|nr:hypothetical protein [Pseudoruegeria sp. HB172150]